MINKLFIYAVIALTGVVVVFSMVLPAVRSLNASGPALFEPAATAPPAP